MTDRRRWRALVARLLGLKALLLAVGCVEPGAPAGAEDASAAGTAIRVETLTLTPAAFDDRIEATGNLEADRDATLSARAGGTLESIARLGSNVRKGEVVARIDPGIPATGVRQAQAAKIAAQASLRLAEQNYNRQKPLFEQGVISALEFQSIEAQLEQARAQLAQAEANLAQAREALSNTRILAPFAGVVDARFVDEGEQVSPGAPVVRVLDASTLIVKAGLPERYAADIEEGAEVDVMLPAYGLEPRTGRVRFVATAIDPRSRTFDIEVALDNPKGRLKPEMVAKVVVTRERLDDALVVPEAAVLRDETGLHVFTVVERGGRTVAERRPVDVVGRAGGRVVVEGLEAGERVVVLGQTKLIDGDYVELTTEMDGAPMMGASPPRDEAGAPKGAPSAQNLPKVPAGVEPR